MAARAERPDVTGAVGFAAAPDLDPLRVQPDGRDQEEWGTTMTRIATISQQLFAVLSGAIFVVGLLVGPSSSLAASGVVVDAAETHCADRPQCAEHTPEGCCPGSFCGADVNGLEPECLALAQPDAAAPSREAPLLFGLRSERDPPPPRPLS